MAALLGLVSCGERAPQLPNLLLITVDTLRADRIACLGGPAGVGEALCGLAADGLRYRWALSTAASTAPSIASLLSSRYPSQHGVSEFALTAMARETQSVAELLGAAGYRTGAVISNPVLVGERGFDQGFGYWDTQMNRSEPNRPGYQERDAQHATDAALAWLGDGDGPWFLWIHYQDPHGPYAPPGAPAPRDEPGGERLRLLGDHSGRGGIPLYQRLGEARAPATYQNRYLDEIRYLDEHIGRLLNAVHQLPGRTGIALTADHGEAFGEDGYWFAHGHSLALDQLHVPLFWRPPDLAAQARGREISRPVSGVDIAPTLIAAAGLPLPEAFEGRPLPTAASEPAQGSGAAAGAAPRALFAEHRLRAAIVLGSHYLARDRRPLAGPVADPISGGWLSPLPARRAELGGAAPPLAPPPAGSAALDLALEALLADFLAREGAAAVSGPGPALSPEARAALAALGYLQ